MAYILFKVTNPNLLTNQGESQKQHPDHKAEAEWKCVEEGDTIYSFIFYTFVLKVIKEKYPGAVSSQPVKKGKEEAGGSKGSKKGGKAKAKGERNYSDEPYPGF